MIAVLFELEAKPGAEAAYFDTAAQLRPLLEGIDGFLSVERFQSLSRPGRYLSLSFWRDEDAVRAWRQQTPHRAAQQAGRSELFADYRLRVAAVLRDYGLRDRDNAPSDSLQALV
ncbi:antibiotic biosynthesis monooxygenase [Hylemonella gracilis]|jgi:heme-degrading monooxygenase HmoA|uniref:Antibiotic biosynthesis monooxygenase n=1 Tax=Hylemonella gracilis TaxID=80880 RepID=A0A4P6UKZ7_9BURK|nr:antibiotic biosynthesis monooxygenase [Hylemonella gracilis]QBK04737.1 antibiotic biosynthesis monooxygenase [Hylemonella gracilis]